MYPKFKYVSICSCRYNDLFLNSGQLIIDNLIYLLPHMPQNIDDLIDMLNDAAFIDTTNTTVLSTMFTFAKATDSKGIANTRI
jgi:hypothetical protein